MPREYDHGRGADAEIAGAQKGAENEQGDPVRVHRAEDGFYSEGAAAGDDLDLDSMTKAELVALADESGVDSSGTKAEIVAALRGE